MSRCPDRFRSPAGAAVPSRRVVWPLVLLLPAWCGCPVTQPLDFPAPISEQRTLQSDRPYYLYVPSTYDPARQWPLVVTCHGTEPFDTAHRQVLEWADLAENEGFIVAAPHLAGTRAPVLGKPEAQVDRQGQDEAAILEVVDRTKAAYHVAGDRVFLTGWSAGGYAVLFTGLRNPGVFRALAIREGNFDAKYLYPVMDSLDRHQPVLVFFGANDLIKGQAEACIRWLRAQQMNIHRREITSGHVRRPDIAYRFFRDAVRRYPWLRAEATAGYDGQRLAVCVRARCSPPATKYAWQFGDGSAAEGLEIVHRYERPGSYQVTLQAAIPKAGTHRRDLQVTVPPVRIGAAAPRQDAGG
jgi:dienelactone hydrolase